jgi:hypothetical protein
MLINYTETLFNTVTLDCTELHAIFVRYRDNIVTIDSKLKFEVKNFYIYTV